MYIEEYAIGGGIYIYIGEIISGGSAMSHYPKPPTVIYIISI